MKTKAVMPRQAYGMLPPCNMGKLFLSSASIFRVIGLAAGIGLLLLGSNVVDAAEATLEAPRVDWSHARQVYRLIETWAVAGKVETSGQETAPILVSGLSGVRVTLRWGGLTVGTGDFLTDQAVMKNDGTVDLAAAAGIATAKALEGVEETLRDMRRRGAASPATNSSAATTRPASVQDAGPRLTADLQLALRLQAIRLEADAPAEAIFHQWAPGFHGLRMTRPTTTGQVAEARIWPASALAANTAPRSQLVQLLAEVGSNVADLPRIARPSGAALERFEMIHLVRPRPDAPPTLLTRGNVVLPDAALSTQTLDNMIERVAGALLRRLDSQGRLAGTYHPTSDRFEPEFAPEEDAALAAYALTRWINQPVAPETPLDPRRAQAQVDVGKIVEQLLARLHDGEEALAPATSALLLLTLIDAPNLADHKADRDRIGRRLLALEQLDGSFAASAGPDAPRVNLPTAALLTAALTSLFEQTRDADLAPHVRSARESLWAQMQPQRMVPALPWLMLIESRRTLLEQDNGSDSAKDFQERRQRLQGFMEALRDCQVTHAPALGPDDVLGGFDLTLGGAALASTSGPPNPDWRSSYVVWFLASALREPGLVPEQDRLAWLLRCAQGARFLAQLMVDEPSCYYMRNPEEALGSPRLTLWDNRLPVPPAALMLLASLELDRTLQKIAAEGGLEKRPE